MTFDFEIFNKDLRLSNAEDAITYNLQTEKKKLNIDLISFDNRKQLSIWLRSGQHKHNNLQLLQLFTTDENGKLFYNGLNIVESNDLPNHKHAISDVNELETSLNDKANSNHDHNDIYYNIDEINVLIGKKLDKSVFDDCFTKIDVATDVSAVRVNYDLIANGQVSASSAATASAGTKDYTQLDNLPSINGVELLGNKTISQLGLVSQAEIDAAIAGLGTVFDLKGSKAYGSSLPQAGNSIGDVWYVEAEQVGYIWITKSGVNQWEPFGAPIDLSGYLTISDAADTYLPFSGGYMNGNILPNGGSGRYTLGTPGNKWYAMYTKGLYVYEAADIECDTTIGGDLLVSGQVASATASTASAGTSDYTQLNNLPQINSVILNGNKTSADLLLASAAHTHSWDNISSKPFATIGQELFIVDNALRVDYDGIVTYLKNEDVRLATPNNLTFTGAVTGTFNGSSAKSVAIPSVDNLIGLPTYDANTYKITFTTQAGATKVIDLPIEAIALSYDAATKTIKFTGADGTIQSIPVGDLVDTYTGSTGSNIQVSVSSGNVISAVLLNRSVTMAQLAGAVQNIINGKAPISHAVDANTYGIGTPSLFGHVKLSNNYATSAGTAAEGMGASSYALSTAYNTLNTKFSNYLPLAGGTMAGDIIPNVSQTYNLGNTDKYWLKAYLKYLSVSTSAYIKDELIVDGTSELIGNVAMNGNATIDGFLLVKGQVAATA